jgi:hypothetical protein
VGEEHAVANRAQFLAMMESRMKQWDADVGALVARRKQAGAMARGAYYEHMKALRDGRKAAHRTLQQLQLLSEATAPELHAHMQAAWDRMQKTLHEISPAPEAGAKP